jgi:hypothetical protein
MSPGEQTQRAPPLPHRSRIFISHAHEVGGEAEKHDELIRDLATSLRAHGLEVILDFDNPRPSVGWPLWIEKNLRDADSVLCVCTAKYREHFEQHHEFTPGERGRGVRFEGMLIRQMIYDNPDQGDRILPIDLDGTSGKHVPDVLRSFTWRRWPDDRRDITRRLTQKHPRQELEATPPGRLASTLDLLSRLRWTPGAWVDRAGFHPGDRPDTIDDWPPEEAALLLASLTAVGEIGIEFFANLRFQHPSEVDAIDLVAAQWTKGHSQNVLPLVLRVLHATRAPFDALTLTATLSALEPAAAHTRRPDAARRAEVLDALLGLGHAQKVHCVSQEQGTHAGVYRAVDVDPSVADPRLAATAAGAVNDLLDSHDVGDVNRPDDRDRRVETLLACVCSSRGVDEACRIWEEHAYGRILGDVRRDLRILDRLVQSSGWPMGRPRSAHLRTLLLRQLFATEAALANASRVDAVLFRCQAEFRADDPHLLEMQAIAALRAGHAVDAAHIAMCGAAVPQHGTRLWALASLAYAHAGKEEPAPLAGWRDLVVRMFRAAPVDVDMRERMWRAEARLMRGEEIGQDCLFLRTHLPTCCDDYGSTEARSGGPVLVCTDSAACIELDLLTLGQTRGGAPQAQVPLVLRRTREILRRCDKMGHVRLRLCAAVRAREVLATLGVDGELHLGSADPLAQDLSSRGQMDLLKRLQTLSTCR